MKSKKQPALACPIDAIGVSARPMLAFSGFYESHRPTSLGNACGIVPVHCHGHQNGQQSGHILHRHFVFCPLGGRRGNTERVVARWRCLVAFMEALLELDLLHQAMCAVSHHCTAMAIKMASNGGTFVCCCRLFCWSNVAKRPWYGPLKLMPSSNINLIGIISLFISYWLPPTTMDAVLATIITGRRAQIWLNIEVSRN